MKFFFHGLEIFISKEKCQNISGSEMCFVKYYSVCSHNQFHSYDHDNVPFIERINNFIFLVIDNTVLHMFENIEKALTIMLSDFWAKLDGEDEQVKKRKKRSVRMKSLLKNRLRAVAYQNIFHATLER